MADGQRIELTAMNNRYFLLFPTEDMTAVVVALRANGVTVDESRIFGYSFSSVPAGSLPTWLSSCSVTVVKTDNPLSVEMIPDLIYLAPFYKTQDGAEIGITNIFSVRPEDEQGIARLEKMSGEYNFDVFGPGDVRGDIFFMSCSKETPGNALQMANLMYDVGRFEYATSEFIIELYPSE
jgi:hypothetical protein